MRILCAYTWHIRALLYVSGPRRAVFGLSSRAVEAGRGHHARAQMVLYLSMMCVKYTSLHPYQLLQAFASPLNASRGPAGASIVLRMTGQIR